ncbi:MAG: hypothetical protein E6K72_07955 [Candidatus Eisenbacteria bacterium]|uniref:Uncharacterized protein n=1 Tax=Eiseniibacteriota bacterium TaxID=2212470 RepID=A0A538SS23_UNCEI|nr:MAG: hypothetical protein E6K72_07955 [Candidatus Eisenbacteria bacterium]
MAGITLGLSVNQAHARLARIGVRATETEAREREAGPGVEQEMWTLRDPRYAYLQVLVGPDGRVRMVEAWVRKGGPGLLFRDIADVREARRLGFWIYRWSAPGRGGKPGWEVIARGSDSLAAGSMIVSSLAADGSARPERRDRDDPDRPR